MRRLLTMGAALTVAALAQLAQPPVARASETYCDVCADYSEEDCTPQAGTFCWAACVEGLGGSAWLTCTWASPPVSCPAAPEKPESCG